MDDSLCQLVVYIVFKVNQWLPDAKNRAIKTTNTH